MNRSDSSIKRRPRWIVKSILLVGVAACGAAAYWMAGGRPKINHGLVVPENELNFGEAWENRAFPWRLTISNVTKQDIFIKDFATSCNCLSIDPPSLLVASGATAELRLTFNLALAPSTDDDSTRRDVTVTMAPVIDEGTSNQKGWNIHGRVVRVLSLDPPRVDFGTDLIRGRPIPAQTVLAKANIPLSGLSAECPASQAVVEVAKSETNPDLFELKVTPASDLPAGRFQFLVTLHPVSENGEKLPHVIFPVEGLVQEYIRALPECLVLGVRPVGQTVAETVVLYSANTEPFQVQSTQTDTGDITVQQAPDQSTSGKTFTVRTNISTLGRKEEQIRFCLTMRNGEKEIVSYSVSYVGIPSDDIDKH
jgi:hypothetical protein